MLDSFVSFWAWVWIQYYIPAFLIVIISKIIVALHLRAQGYDKWWLAIIPFCHLFCKRELSGLQLYLIIPYLVFTVLFLWTYDFFFFIIMLVLCVLINRQYAYICIDSCNPWIYSLVPFYKYFIMLKEARQYAGNESR